MAEKLLRASDLSKTFKGFRALKNVSLSLESGELLALIGPNGAGKSTCFNCINGQLKPDSGQVWFDGREITGWSTQRMWRAGISRTFQITATFLSMTALENVQMALMSARRDLFRLWKPVKGRYAKEALELLAMVGLADSAERLCAEMAYGDLKRLELAIALASKPKLLLMDEPAAGMGEKEQHELMKLTHHIAKEQNIGVLFTEHNVKMVFDFADNIVVLHNGELLASGKADNIVNNPLVKAVYLGSM